ncbi:hypothetical protein A1Q1_04781 [Trichosporon asahii var. asahii CBS 2479]|uniref:F-box domain-containing protein n=1 Tax=Trichosporon asahii var. asahii (strain ATCC 90039 / CBS 2479 / JCM 2466 / KCTC 7840 / NBRC 103889/ NCYC 2677 / UAMH 7654) TaxID=1186058 RepID=J6EQ65_TRIAS|nr:hypothetical protein A1Q1_04781 [Trichosporon asahii var. asahii CBS 2479]EJT46604.1 hypothetical protein A1Q1_04781 [Trichosporon asahii var. asahii CBS 2479]
MSTTFNPDDFPHIIEAVVWSSDWPTLLKLRLVSSRMKRLVDPLLCKDLLELSTDSTGDLTVSAWIPWLYDHPLCIPYFHPSGNEFIQRAAMNRAKRIRVICERATFRLNELLQWISPEAEVVFLHSPAAVFDVDTRIPVCAGLTIEAQIDPHCACQDESRGKLTHQSKAVAIHFVSGGGEERSGLPRCVVLDGAVNLGVHHLDLVDYFSDIRPMLCGDADIDTHPELRVRVKKRWGSGSERARLKLAERFSVEESRVYYW